LIRGTVFSDPQVIDLINSEFIPVDVEITNYGFPQIPALQPIFKIYEKQYFCKFGFSVNIVIGPGINFPLGILAGNEQSSLNTAIEYSPMEFYRRLVAAKNRYEAALKMNEKELEILYLEVFND